MKNSFAFLLIIFLLSACRKSHPDVTTIKYEFTTDVSAKFQLDYAISSSSVTALIFDGTSWSQNVVVSKGSQPGFLPVARLTAYPPATWAGTTNSAHINLTIIVDGDKKANVDTTITSADTGGITGEYMF